MKAPFLSFDGKEASFFYLVAEHISANAGPPGSCLLLSTSPLTYTQKENYPKP